MIISSVCAIANIVHARSSFAHYNSDADFWRMNVARFPSPTLAVVALIRHFDVAKGSCPLPKATYSFLLTNGKLRST